MRAITPALLATLTLCAVASADVETKFADLRDKSKPLGSLSGFLDKYIGECKDPLEGPTCKSNAADFRKKTSGQSYYMIVSEDSATMLSPGPYNPTTGEYTINVTPFFPAGGYAVTEGSPKRADANGNPVLPFIQMHGKVGEGWNGQRFNSLFMRRGLRLLVIFTPNGVWNLSKPGGGKNAGISAKIHALLVEEGRSGTVMGTWYAK